MLGPLQCDSFHCDCGGTVVEKPTGYSQCNSCNGCWENGAGCSCSEACDCHINEED